MTRNPIQRMTYLAALAALVAIIAAGTMWADTIISAQFENNQGYGVSAVNYSGVEPDAVAADPAFANSNVWNHLQAGYGQSGPIFFSNLLSSTGSQTGASFSISNISGAWNAESNLPNSDLPDTYFYSYNSSQTFTFSGLAPDESFTLFLYAYTHGGSGASNSIFSVGSSSFDTINGKLSSEDSNAVTGEITGTTSTTGTITGTWAFDSSNTAGEIDWSGFQLDVASPATTATPECCSLLLFGTGLMGLALAIRKRSCQQKKAVSHQPSAISDRLPAEPSLVAQRS